VCKVLRGYVPEASFPSLPGRRGSLGIVLDGGPVAVGDPVHVEPERYPVVPDGVYDRLAWVVARIPEGRVLTSERLMTAVGAPRAYSRVLPTYLARARDQGLPAHRVLTRDGRLSRHLPGQRARLAGEGVELEPDAPAGPDLVWDAVALYR
jgi:alkylated DNA nucleotide flippase Atl1